MLDLNIKVGDILNHNKYVECIDEAFGITYLILFSSGGWRCAYVDFTGTSFECYDYMSLDAYFDVHGGFTYGEHRLPFELENTNIMWFGWDYAHAFDGYDLKSAEKYFEIPYSNNELKLYTGHIFTLEEVKADCVRICEQLYNREWR